MLNIQPTQRARGSASALVVLAFAACKAKRLSEELPAADTHRAAEQNRPTGLASKPAPGQLLPAPGAPGERPSVDQNMGRGFQGSLALRVLHAAGGEQDLRYLSRGNTARLQLDTSRPRAAAPLHVDALIWGESVSILDHEQRSVQTFALRKIRPGTEPESDVRVHATGERSSIQGVFCERYLIQAGPLSIDAQVSGLPGTFDVDKLEAVTGLDVPAWVEVLVKDELLPLQARIRNAQGRALHTLELVHYAPGPIDPELLAVPVNYRRLTDGEAALSQGNRAR